MKRASFSFSDSYSRFPEAAEAGQQALLGTVFLAITIATVLSGAIWFA